MSARLHAFSDRFARDGEGATALEFAMVLPVFIALLFAIFQFGLAQHRIASLRYALNEASRAVMLNPEMTEAQVSDRVKAKLEALADPDVTVTLAITDHATGRIARLTGVYVAEVGVPLVATYPFSFTTTVDAALPPKI